MLVSIIIPCYNVENYVARAIESALAQTYLDTEIICVDNNSTDGTLEILYDYHKKYPEKIQVFQEYEQGAPAARNLGMKYAKGEWLQFLDADDEILPGKLARQLKLKDVGNVILGTPLVKSKDGGFEALTLWDDVWKGLGHVSHCGQTSANLYHRRAIEMVNGWDESLTNGQDTDLLLRLLQKKTTCILDKIPGSIYNNDARERITNMNPEKAHYSHSLSSVRLIQYLKSYKVDYWIQNKKFFYLSFYHHLRMLACFDPVKAQLLFDQYLPKGFRIEADKSLKIPYWDALFVNVIGLKRFATIKNRLKVLFPDSLWRAMKFTLNGIWLIFPNNPK